jgi:NADP-dependent 3-hydroxy acid dehydrogenase YdfG
MIVVTGAPSGLGHELSRLLIANGVAAVSSF